MHQQWSSRQRLLCTIVSKALKILSITPSNDIPLYTWSNSQPALNLEFKLSNEVTCAASFEQMLTTGQSFHKYVDRLTRNKVHIVVMQSGEFHFLQRFSVIIHWARKRTQPIGIARKPQYLQYLLFEFLQGVSWVGIK
jgi:hypothetical protein